MQGKTFLKFAGISLALSCIVTLADPAAAQQNKARSAQQPAQQQPQKIPEPEKTFPTGSSWTLREVNTKRLDAGLEATLTIDSNNRGTGISGCNTWASPLIPVPGQRLAMGAIALTKRACSPAIMAFEQNFLLTLHSGPYWDIEGSDLIIKTPNTTLRFSRGY
jgi:heat shock protein HslJ